MQASGQKKLVHIFKTFVEKSIVPQLRKLEGSLTDWNKFCTLLLSDSINYIDLQMFVDSLPIWGASNAQNLLSLNRKTSGENNDGNVFNPSRTFGGEKNKFNIMNIGEEKSDIIQRRESQREESIRQRVSTNNMGIMANLDKLMKIL